MSESLRSTTHGASSTDLETANSAGRPVSQTEQAQSLDGANYQYGSEALDWLVNTVGLSTDQLNIRYLGRPGSNPSLLLPVAPARAAAAALRRPHDGRDRAEIAKTIAARMMARTGLLRFGSGRIVELPQFALVEHLASVMGEPELRAAVTLGGLRRNRKPVLQLIRPDGRTVGFVKVGWSPMTAGLVYNETATLKLMEGRLPKPFRVPRVIHHETWEGKQVGVVTPVTNRAPELRRPPTTVETVLAIARAESLGLRAVNRMWLFEQWRGNGVAEHIDLERLAEKRGDVQVEIGLWHGDLTPWNQSSRLGTLLIWDWEFAGRGRPIGFDALHQLFELHRRRPGGTNQSAITALTRNSSRVLGELGLNLSKTQADTILELYLAELVSREQQLSKQRWSGYEETPLTSIIVPEMIKRLG